MYPFFLCCVLIIAFGTFLSGSAEIPAGSCGVNKYNPSGKFLLRPYIVGGQSAAPNSYPWQVSLQARGNHMCGGTIIDDQFILTAAQCFNGPALASYWSAVVGKHSLFQNETGQKTYSFKMIIRHPKFYKGSDIALIKLSEKLTFDENVQPICMPPETIGTLEGNQVTVTGWGSLREGGLAAPLLQEVQLPVITNAKCQEKYPQERINNSMICAGYDVGGHDACLGDTGGPMAMQVNRKWTLIGIVSWSYGCAEKDQPGVYTRVSSYLSWINDNKS